MSDQHIPRGQSSKSADSAQHQSTFFDDSAASSTQSELNEPVVNGSMEELTARILQCTSVLQASGDEVIHLARRGACAKKAAMIAGASVGMVIAILGAAYALGSEPEALVVDDAGLTRASTHTVSMTQWPQDERSENISKDLTAPVRDSLPLSSADVQALRAQGWCCPDFSSVHPQKLNLAGFSLHGVPIVQTVVQNDGGELAVYEWHQAERGNDDRPRLSPATGASGPREPLNPLTSHNASMDGFQPLGGGSIWLRPGAQWQALVQEKGSTFLIASTRAPSSLKSTVDALTVSDSSMRPAAGSTDSTTPESLPSTEAPPARGRSAGEPPNTADSGVWHRLWRGLHKILTSS